MLTSLGLVSSPGRHKKEKGITEGGDRIALQITLAHPHPTVCDVHPRATEYTFGKYSVI